MEELDLMYKQLASIEKKIAELDSQVYDARPGSKAAKELGKQLEGLEEQFAVLVNKITATENKLVASSEKASESLVSTVSSGIEANQEATVSVQQLLASRAGHIASLAQEESALRQLASERAALDQSEKSGSLSMSEVSARRSELIDKEMAHRQASSELRVALIAETNAVRASDTLVGNLSASMEKMSGTYRDMSEASRNSGLGELPGQIQQVEAELSNYEKVMDGIEKNIPALADEIRRVMDDYQKNLVKLKESNGGVSKGVAPWKQLTSSIFSWQSALAVGVLLLVTYWKDIVNFGKGLLGIKQEQEGLTESLVDFNKESIKESRNLRDTYSAIMRTNQGTEERKKAIDDMNAQYGKFLPHLLTEKSSLDEINAAYETVNSSLRANTALKMRNKAVDEIMEKAIGEQAEVLTEMRESTTKAVGKQSSDGIMSTITGLTEDFRLAGSTWKNAYLGVLAKVRGELGGKTLDDSFDGNLKTYVKSVYKTENQISEVDNKYGQFINNGKPATTYDHSKEEEIRNETKRKAQEDATEILRVQKELDKELLADKKRMQDYRDSLEEEGKNKRMKSLEQEHEAAMRQIDEKEKEQLSRPGITDSQKTQVTSLASEARVQEHEKLLKGMNDLDAEYKTAYEERMKSMSGVSVNEEARKLSAIKERYDKEREWANRQLETGGINKEQHQAMTSVADKNEMKEKYNALLGGLNDFKQQEADLEESWRVRIEGAKASGDTNLTQILETGRSKALSGLHSQMLQESSEWLRLFGNLDTLTVEELDQLQNSIKQKMASGEFEMNAIDTKAALDSLQKVSDVVAQKSPFHALANSSGEMKQALAGLKQAEEDGLTGEALDVYKVRVKEAAENVQKSIATIASTYGQVRDVMKSVADLVGMVDKDLGETINNSIALGDAVMNVGTVVSDSVVKFSQGMSAMETASVILLVIKAVITAVMAAMSLFNGDKKHEKKIQAMQKEVDNLSRAYDRLGRTIDNTYSNAVYGMMDEQAENLKRQQQLVLQQKKEEEDKKKTDNKKVDEYDKKFEELGNQAEDMKKKQIEMLAGTDVQTAIDNFADALVEAYAQGENGAEAMGEATKKVLANAVKEALKKQLLGDALKNAVTRLGEDMKDGTLSAEDKRRFENSAQSAGQHFMEAMKMYDELFKGEKDSSLEESLDDTEELRKKQIEMLAGTDVQSAIDNFANALVEAYARGEDGAEAMGETTKKVLANAVKETLKKKLLGDALQNAVTRLGEDMEDGTLSDEDKRRFENSAQSAGQRFMESMKMYDELFKGEGEAEAPREASAKGIASMSQESADLLNGQFTTQLIYLDRTCTEVTGIREQMALIRELQVTGWEDVRVIRDMSGRIAELSDRIATVSDKIEINTGLAARGIQDINDKGVLMRGR